VTRSNNFFVSAVLFFAIFMAVIPVLACFNSLSKKFIEFYMPQKGIYIIDININDCPNCIVPYVSDSLETVQEMAEKNNAIVAINAGFFDPKNSKTTSYVVKDKQIIADPTLNQDLINNPILKQYLPGILNRSELRIQNCFLNTGKVIKQYKIVQHNVPSDMKCEIIHSIQAGPELLPELKLSEEAFVIKKDGKVVKESAGALSKCARSAVGIKNNHVFLVAISNSKQMTLEELAQFMKELGVDQAMAFDGGSSTSLYVNLPDQKKFNLVSAKENSARKVKSVLLIKPGI